MKRVVVESPYAGERDRLDNFIEGYFPGASKKNIEYTCACMNDCFKRGEAPFASHLLYTQKGILNDTIPGERRQGIEAGFEWGECAELTAVYTDLGISKGMEKGIGRANKTGRGVEYRTLGGKWTIPKNL